MQAIGTRLGSPEFGATSKLFLPSKPIEQGLLLRPPALQLTDGCRSRSPGAWEAADERPHARKKCNMLSLERVARSKPLQKGSELVRIFLEAFLEGWETFWGVMGPKVCSMPLDTPEIRQVRPSELFLTKDEEGS